MWSHVVLDKIIYQSILRPYCTSTRKGRVCLLFSYLGMKPSFFSNMSASIHLTRLSLFSLGKEPFPVWHQVLFSPVVLIIQYLHRLFHLLWEKDDHKSYSWPSRHNIFHSDKCISLVSIEPSCKRKKKTWTKNQSRNSKAKPGISAPSKLSCSRRSTRPTTPLLRKTWWSSWPSRTSIICIRSCSKEKWASTWSCRSSLIPVRQEPHY